MTNEDESINYLQGSDEMRKAWFKFKEMYNNSGVAVHSSPLSVVSFAAGWNAAKNDKTVVPGGTTIERRLRN